MKVINKMQETFIMRLKTNYLIGLMKLLCFILLMGHLVACCFLYMGEFEKSYN